jgi:hypothetical protein
MCGDSWSGAVFRDVLGKSSPSLSCGRLPLERQKDVCPMLSMQVPTIVTRNGRAIYLHHARAGGSGTRLEAARDDDSQAYSNTQAA